ncbi:MAG: YaiO family outer membrane beta-barrel protein [Bacteroidales bacterium]|jgi:YaiO family outer membrane protein|nr:YaiO family outer membrane beta-barrel protein [Bacteroidales bacterium]
MRRITLYIVFFGLSCFITEAQPQPDVDSLYYLARQNAHSGKLNIAREQLRTLLTLSPGHADAILLTGQTYGWNSQFDSARITLRQLLPEFENDTQWLLIAANTEFWDKQYAQALVYTNKGLVNNPHDESFLSLQTRITEELQREKQNQYQDYVFLEQYFENYASPNTRLVTSTGLYKGLKRASYIARLNVGEKIPLIHPAYQIELEGYQKLFPSNYLYGEYAFSASNAYFPRHKAALEFFQAVAKPVEVSLGGRMIDWNSHTIQWILTGSVSYTYHLNYFCLRGFYDFHSQESLVLNYRRYFGNKREQYFYVAGAVGSYSDELVQFNALRDNAYTAIVGIQKYLTHRWFIHANAGYTYESDGRVLATLGARYFFNMFNKK